MERRVADRTAGMEWNQALGAPVFISVRVVVEDDLNTIVDPDKVMAHWARTPSEDAPSSCFRTPATIVPTHPRLAAMWGEFCVCVPRDWQRPRGLPDEPWCD